MSCCGGNRGMRPSHSAGASAPVPSPSGHRSLAIFRYDGPTSLTVFGRITGRKYWFSANGAEVAVDIRDRESMKQVPRLIELRLA